MSFGTDVGAAGQGGTGSYADTAQQAYNIDQPTAQQLLDKLSAQLGGPENLKFAGELASGGSRLLNTYHKASPEQQQMLNAHVNNQIQKMMGEQQQRTQQTPYLGDIPPELAQQILHGLGIPAGSGYGVYRGF